jgi:hypothetical protein
MARMTRITPLWLDTESDGFHGRLLSVGITSQAGKEFYGALPAMHLQSAWAVRHVQPHLGEPTHMDDIQLALALAGWLRQFEAVEVIADWHRDLVHFFALLGPVPGQQLSTPPVFASLKTWLNGACGDAGGPLHHSLHDARRLMVEDLRQTGTPPTNDDEFYPVVPFNEFARRLLATVRGEEPPPAWAGKTVYASAKAAVEQRAQDESDESPLRTPPAA